MNSKSDLVICLECEAMRIGNFSWVFKNETPCLYYVLMREDYQKPVLSETCPECIDKIGMARLYWSYKRSRNNKI